MARMRVPVGGSRDIPPVAPAPDTPSGAVITEDDSAGVVLELACSVCGCLVQWAVGEPFPACPRCDA